MPETPDFDLVQHSHLVVVGGSRAYGLARPDSDVDLKGVAIPPLRHFLGIRDRFEQIDSPGAMAPFAPLLTDEERAAASARGLEGSIYGLHKLARLALDCNPHLLDILFCREDEIRLVTPVGAHLRQHRDLFLSRRARGSFGSYATAQLKRIQGHRRWLLDPPEGPPSRAEYGLPETSLPDTASAEERTQEARFRRASTAWQQYSRWKRERNPARAALEASWGYDTKHASHLVRLLRMATEILETGEVHVWRGDRDADELRAIREGAWSYRDLIAWAERTDAHLDALEARSALPERADLDAIDALVVDLVERSANR